MTNFARVLTPRPHVLIVGVIGVLLALAALRLPRATSVVAGHEGALDTPRIDPPAAAIVPNVGQWADACRFRLDLGGMFALLDEHGWTLVLAPVPRAGAGDGALPGQPATPPPAKRQACVRMSFAGSLTPDLVPEQKLAGVHHYFLGNDPARWRTDVPRLASVLYRGLYPGVDVRVYPAGRHLEYDLLVAPDADLARVEVAVDGATSIQVGAEGELVIGTPMGTVRQPRPITWEVDAAGQRCPVVADYELRAGHRFGFTAPRWRRQGPLVVDPTLEYSTFLGGAHTSESAQKVHVGPGGIITLAGITGSYDFPTTANAWDTTWNFNVDVFVSRLDPSLPQAQQLVYSTYIGGRLDDRLGGFALDANGRVVITAATSSFDWPTTPGAFDTTGNGQSDIVVARLDPSLPASQQLTYSTFLGGSGSDDAPALAVSGPDRITIVGTTGSPDYPTTPGAWDTVFSNVDMIITQLDPSRPAAQQLVYSTFFGGSLPDFAYAATVGSTGIITLAGVTRSSDYPTTPNAYARTLRGSEDVTVSQLDPSRPASQQLVYSTLLGGTTTGGTDIAYNVGLEPSGVIVVSGTTSCTDFPTTANARDRQMSGASDMFVARLDPTRSGPQQLLYSTLLGGRYGETPYAMVVEGDGLLTLAGGTGSDDYPTTFGAWDRTYGGQVQYGSDGFVTRLATARPAAQQLDYSTFLGASGYDFAFGLIMDSGAAVVVGSTSSLEFPTTPGAWDTVFNHTLGGYDAFVTRLKIYEAGSVSYYGVGCAGTGSGGAGHIQPPSYATAMGSGGTTFPFCHAGLRYQQQVLSRDLPTGTYGSLSVRQPATIPGVGGGTQSVKIVLGYSTGFSTTFDSNFIPATRQVVYEGVINIPTLSGTNQDPRRFAATWHFSVPFVHTSVTFGPSLLLEVVNTSTTVVGQQWDRAPGLNLHALSPTATTGTLDIMRGMIILRFNPIGGVPVINNVGVPEIGKGFSMTVSNARAGSIAALCLGLQQLDHVIPPYIAKGCRIHASFDFLPAALAITDPDGFAAMAPLVVPNALELRGLPIFMQWHVVEPGLNYLNRSFSNGCAARIGG